MISGLLFSGHLPVFRQENAEKNAFSNTFQKNAAFRENPEKICQNVAKMQQNSENFAKFCKKSAKSSAVFKEKSEIRERCKGVHFVDLDETFPTSIYLQNLASIQRRTSPKKFATSNSREG